MKKVKFIHGADIHLDSPMVGLQTLPENIFKQLQESTFKAFRNLIDAAILHEVDFVILAGDIFDNEDRSVRAQVFLRKQLERLEEKGIPAYIVHGNHDHLGGNWNEIVYPSNVHIFGETVEVKEIVLNNNVVVHLHGFSYRERHVLERQVRNYQKKTGADYHIGILHGNMEGNSEHGNYAPFQLKELLEKEFDYWALGHIHKRSIVYKEPFIVYAGNTQGRNKKETDEKGCFLVNLQKTNSELQFIETSEVIWTDLILDATNISHFDHLLQYIQVEISKQRREGKGIIASVKLLNVDSELIGADSFAELVEILQEDEKDEKSFVWPARIQVEEKVHWSKEKLAMDSDFYGELFKVMDELGSIEETLSPLYNQHNTKKLLPKLSLDEMEEIRKSAETLLINRLLKNR